MQNICHNNLSDKPKKWYERASVRLCIAAFLILIFGGFIHIVTGIETSWDLPFDFAFKKSFGFRETIVNARKIASIPYVTAKIKYPKSCEVLQKLGYIKSGEVFDTAMKDMLISKFKSWQREFVKSNSGSEKDWHDKLIGETGGIDKSSKSAESYNSLGLAAAKQNRFEDAISEFTRALNKNPAFANAYFNRALVYTALGHVEKAVSDYTKVIEISPRFNGGFTSRGDIYLAKGEYEKAISDFTKAIEIDSKNAEAYFSRSLACFALGEYDDVWADVRKIQASGKIIPSEYLALLQKVSNQ
jgi:tetratricopeptide (TPR) repeat protein